MADPTPPRIGDPLFARPYVDVDEWRDVPVRHRYVHGGFTGTDTRFSAYFPPADRYEGRFFQHITPVPDSEHLAQAATGEQDRISFAISSGGYFLETNGGGPAGRPGSAVDPTIAAYGANAAAAGHARVVAAQIYGEHRPYGYAYGGSGGYRTIGSAENTSGVWDGFVPYVIGSPMAIPNMFTVRMHAQRVLRERFEQIVDAVEPGGSGDMFDGLDEEERGALTEVTRMGFPPRSWFGYRTMGMHAFPVLYRGLVAADPTYFDDFWQEPGYLGYEAPPSLRRDRVREEFEIEAVITGDERSGAGASAGGHPGQARGGVDTAWRGARPPAPVAVRLSGAPPVDVRGADLFVRSGAAAGSSIGLLSVVGHLAVFGPGGEAAIGQIRAGDTVAIDNSGYLAAETYHRHQVPEGGGFAVWDQFRKADGSPIYPQRPLVLGPLFASAAAGSVQSGHFDGKMIVVESLLDREALPWQADWYRGRVAEHRGDTIDDHFRLWFTDNALHGDDELQESPLHTISYLGALYQALRDLSRWVEEDVAPPRSTNYEVVDGQVMVPADAAERGGIQPVVSLTVNGGLRAESTFGEELTFRAVAEVPPGSGVIIEVAWDFDGTGRFAEAEPVTAATSVVVERRCALPEVGTCFPAVRVVAHRDGNTASPFARQQNLARVRVVVGDPPRGEGRVSRNSW
jgi:hypothetical protein